MARNNISCGIVPIRKNKSHWEFLILRCYKNWDFPKGMKEDDEDHLEAAQREFTEETGIQKIEMIPDKFIETEPYSQGKIARYYLGIVDESAVVEILPNPVTGILEHHEYRWMKAEEAMPLLVPRLQKILAWATSTI